MSKNSTLNGKISNLGLIGLYTYFTLLAFTGIFGTCSVILINQFKYDQFKIFSSFIINSTDNSLNLYNLAFIGSISSAICGSCVAYIKKLYVLSLGGKFDSEISSKEDYIVNYGTILYFIYRPIFSIIFSIIMFLAIKIGILPILNNLSKISDSIVDIFIIFSFFIGFGTGSVLESLEKIYDPIVTKAANCIKKSLS
ncbi:hypothetical protein [Paraclostridium sordellii]|uniref:hypothetical protein n=1 Tax=Paraclostridium sordellii TaxID=1505 RepID=UPI0005DDE78D|nr:hypothetical protein [Paeniclostridium sordellii]CEP43375.1 Uncharacterised protein [[Clostridium] sordellii] [Paeniclostridium sordellii]